MARCPKSRASVRRPGQTQLGDRPFKADDLVKTLTVSSPSAQTTTYAYDTANRLLSGVVASSTEYAYGYNKASNLTSITSGGATESYTYTSTNSITSGTYDSNGSPLSLGGNTYKWDGANRLVHFTSTSAGTASTFVYDGLGRLVRVVDTASGAITADHAYLWCGNVRCAAHDNTQTGSQSAHCILVKARSSAEPRTTTSPMSSAA